MNPPGFDFTDDGQNEPDPVAPEAIDEYWQALGRGADRDKAKESARAAWRGVSAGQLKILDVLHDEQETGSFHKLPTESSARAPLVAEESHGPKPALAPGESLLGGTLLILSLLDRGGMGEVYVAWHAKFNREIAVKVLPERMRARPAMEQRFLRSIQTQVRIGPHSHIAGIMHADEHQGRHYLMMEYVPGINLNRYVHRHKPLPWTEALNYIRQTAEGLKQAHREGIIHRDIKPSNLIRGSTGTIKILDWGLARCDDVSGAPNGDTQSGMQLGTADYIAPEQAQDAKRADPRSDLYSLGCTLYFLLTGQAPFAEESSGAAKIAAHLTKPAPSIRDLRDDVPQAVDELARRLMAKKPQDRPASAAELIDWLDALLVGQPSPAFARRRSRRTALTLLGLTGGGLFWGLWHWRPKRFPSSKPPELVELRILFIPTNGAGRDGEPVTFIANRQLKSFLPDRRVRADEGFRLEGLFERPEAWWLVWIDTRGKVGRPVGPGKKQAAVGYKLDGSGTAIDPDDPAGTHLLLLLTAADPVADAETILAGALATVSPPPQAGLHIWHEDVFRGEGTHLETPTSYVTRLRQRLPKGFALAAAIFLPADQAVRPGKSEDEESL